VQELVDAGVTDVVIFKNELKHEVQDEEDALENLGITGKHVLHLDFRWKNIESFTTACQQTIQALAFLDQVANKKDAKAYFHCTVGEDRTGMLAGLIRMLEEGWSVEKAFESELCQNGYEAGNPAKPPKVVQAIRKELTPVFLKMAFLIESKALTRDSIDASLCKDDPELLESFSDSNRYNVKNYRCKASSLFQQGD
jgi:hypothetical protein